MEKVTDRGSHKAVVYLGRPIVPPYLGPNAGEEQWEVAGSWVMSTAVHWSPNKRWRSNSTFNLQYGNRGGELPLDVVAEHWNSVRPDSIE